MNQPLTIQLLLQRTAVCRFPGDAQIPAWLEEGSFFSLTRTEDELSVVCKESCVPDNAVAERNWRILKVIGPLDFALTGILSSLVHPLAEAEIPVFALSTYETDYLLIKEEKLKEAMLILGRKFEMVVSEW